MKKCYTYMFLILVGLLGVHLCSGQEQRYLDSLAKTQKPIIRALTDSLKLTVFRNQEAMKTITDSAQIAATKQLYHKEIKRIKLQLLHEKNVYKDQKVNIVMQARAYYKEQPYYKYKRTATVFSVLGYAAAAPTIVFFFASLGEPKDSHLKQPNYFIPFIASAASTGSFLLLGSIYNRKFKKTRYNDNGFKLSVAPTVVPKQPIGVHVGLRIGL